MTVYTVDAEAFNQNIDFVSAYDIFFKRDQERKDLTAATRKASVAQVFIVATHKALILSHACQADIFRQYQDYLIEFPYKH